MPNYQLGKIYAIISPSIFKCYIGSTTQKYISQRLNGHKSLYNMCTSKDVINQSEYHIMLLEYFPCKTKQELLAREGHWIKAMGNLCVNKNIMGRTRQETLNAYNKSQKRKETTKRYNDNHTDKYKLIYTCSCGGTYTYKHKARHEKTSKHLKTLS